MKTIYNTYVKMESQEQCDRMKQLCIDNGLPIDYGFTIDCKYFEYCSIFDEWNVWHYLDSAKTEITEEEFIKLLQDEQENK